MKRKILSVMLTVVLALGVVFTAVGCASALEKYYKTADKTYAPYSAATEVTALAGFEKEDQKGNLVSFHKNGDEGVEKAIFDLNKGSVIATFTISGGNVGDVELIDVPAVEQTLYKTKITKADETKPTYKLYSQAATEIASVTTDNFGGLNAKLDLVKFDNAVYRVAKDGSVVKAFDVSDLSRFDIDMLQYKAEGYYYGTEEGNNGEMICVFNEKGELVSNYPFPSFAENKKWNVLNNGNVFVQYLVREDAFGESYDYIEDDAKYTVEQFIVNPKNGDVKDVKDSKNLVIVGEVTGVGVMYDISYNSPWGSYRYGGVVSEGVDVSFKNMATGYKVLDKKYDEYNDITFEMSNSGKLSEIEDFIPALRSVSYRYGYYFVSNQLGQQFLYSSDAKLVGEITNANGWNSKFIYTAKAVYDYNLNKVFDLEDYEVEELLDSTLILSKTVTVDNADVVKYYLLKEGAAPAEICDEDSFMGADRKYYIVENEGKLDCYNEVGTKLLTVDMVMQEPTILKSTDEAKMLVKLGDVYYYVA